MSDDWSVGAEVIEVSSGFYRTAYGNRYRIGKVYANGNFVLEGDDTRQQWRPWSGRATRTGSYGGRTVLKLFTPELEAEKDHDTEVLKASRALAAESARLDKLARSNDDNAILEAYRALSKGEE